MITGPDFIWLHFPKCAGTETERILRHVFGDNPEMVFDEIDPSNVVWHETVAERKQREPFDINGRRIIANFRRLPHWALSRFFYERSRSPHVRLTRKQFLSGHFVQRSGRLCHVDWTVARYLEAQRWIRVEHLADDLSDAFSLDPEFVRAAMKPTNSTDYVRDLEFYFTPSELEGLYAACPKWAALERELYGDTLRL